MTTTVVTLLPPHDGRVRLLLDTCQEEAPHARGILFAGDRGANVEVCAVATRNGLDVGLATLAPCDEQGQGGPAIIGLWVTPWARKRGIASSLLAALAEESVRRYVEQATVVCITTSGLRAAKRAQASGAHLIVVDQVMLPNL